MDASVRSFAAFAVVDGDLPDSAQWLEHSCGIAHRTAVEHVRIGRSLRAWPRLSEEMGAGRLSYSQVRAISRVATGPVEESIATADLVEDRSWRRSTGRRGWISSAAKSSAAR